MKLYKRFKGMKGNMKVGLVSSAVYAASAFALPAFANTVEQPVFQPVDVTTITTSEQAENVYSTKLTEYSQDKKMTIDEIKQLGDIKSKEKSILEKQITQLRNKKGELREKANKLHNQASSYKGKLANLDSQLQHPNIKKALEENLNRFEEDILIYYPGLVKNDGGMTYSAETRIKPVLEPFFNKIAENTHKILKDNYGYYHISVLLNRSITLGDVRAFYDILKAKISTIKDDGGIDEKALIQQKQDLENKIKRLESKRISILNSETIKQLEAKIGQISEEVERVEKPHKILATYLNRHDDIESFTKNHTNLRKYFSLSLIDAWRHYHTCDGCTYGVPYENMRRDLGNGKELMSNLESYFKGQGFDVKIVDKLPNPAKPKLPLWIIPMVLAAPIFRNMLVIKHLGGGKQTGGDYGGGAIFGLIETFLFYCFLDSIHPFVFPVRMIGIPFVWHGLLKATGADKATYEYAK